MKDEIRIKLSVGLIVVAVIHAVLLGAVFTALHQRPIQRQDDWTVPSPPPVTPEVGRIEKLEIPSTVNLQAQGELKQQIIRRPCNPCPPTVVQPLRGALDSDSARESDADCCNADKADRDTKTCKEAIPACIVRWQRRQEQAVARLVQ